MNVHQMDVKKEFPVLIDPQELCRGIDAVDIRPVDATRDRLRPHCRRRLARTRREIDIKALIESEIRCDPAISPDPGRRPTVLFENFRGHLRRRRDRILVRQNIRPLWVEARPK